MRGQQSKQDLFWEIIGFNAPVNTQIALVRLILTWVNSHYDLKVFQASFPALHFVMVRMTLHPNEKYLTKSSVMTQILGHKMNFIPDIYIVFHFMGLLFRTELIIIHILQFVAIFYLQVVDQIVHSYFTSAIWVLHPIVAITDIRKCVRDRKDKGSSKGCPFKMWVGSNVSRFFSELNLVTIHAQNSEITLREFFSSIEIKDLLDSVDSFLTSRFPFLAKDKDAGIESAESSELETKKWYHNQLWDITKKNMLFAYFQNIPAPEIPFIDIIDTPCSGHASKSDKIEELADSEVSAPLAEISLAPKTAEPYITPFFPDLKALWADRKRRKKS